MEKVTVGNQVMEVVLKEKVTEKMKELHMEKDELIQMIQGNIEDLISAEEKEEVLLMGEWTLLLYKEGNQLVVSNLFGKQNIL
jgi:predicted transcriptional regulator